MRLKLVLCIGCMAHAPFAVPSLFRDNIVRGGGLRGRYSVSVCVHGMKGGGAFCCASLHPLPLACIHTTALVQCPPSSESITGEWRSCNAPHYPNRSRVNGGVANRALASRIQTLTTSFIRTAVTCSQRERFSDCSPGQPLATAATPASVTCLQ